MPKRIKVEGRTGVFYRIARRVGGPGTEKIYYVTYKVDGKKIEARAGRQYKDQMTPAKAAQYRSRLIDGREMTPQAKRKAEKAAKQAEDNKWTVDKLWVEYKAGRKPGKSLSIDEGRYEKYLKSYFGYQEPKDILSLDVERLKRRLLKKRSPQTVKHILSLLTWIIHFGTKQGLCPGLTFHIKKPRVDNETTEDLTQDQLGRLLKAIREDTHHQAGNLMLLGLFSGMRRSEMFRLEWRHLDFEKSFISIVGPKGGRDQRIPMNDATRNLFEGIKRVKGSPFVFPGRGGKQRTDINKAVSKIKQKAGLPSDFRALHGLRHVFASQLASSGQVDLYAIQKLLTHRDPRMTQRYSHLRDEALKKASSLAGNFFSGITEEKPGKKVVNLSDNK